MNSKQLIDNYGSANICPSIFTLFNFSLNTENKTATIALSKEVDKSVLTEIIIPYEYNINGISYIVTEIGIDAFSSCENLTNVIVPNTVTIIHDTAFKNCKKLNWVRLSNKLVTIEKQAFYGCSNLKVMAFSETVRDIKEEAFLGCNNLKKVIVKGENLKIETPTQTFPLSNEGFKFYANPYGDFCNNTELQFYILTWNEYDGIYYYCDGMVDKVIFYNSDVISSNIILFSFLLKNNGITKEIDEDAFIGCYEMRVLEINTQVTIKTNTFVDCTNLTDVFINNNNIKVATKAFPFNNQNFTIYTNSHAHIIKNKELQPYIFLFKDNCSTYNSQMFIAGVGEVELFKDDKVVLTSKTLIDTGINLTVNLEDIQGNGGAKLYGKYASQAGLTIKLTDAMFRMEFLAANLGTDVELGGSAIVTEHSIVQNGVVKIEGNPLPLYFGDNKKAVWISEEGGHSGSLFFSEDNMERGAEDDFGKILIKNVSFPNGTQVCVKYIKEYEEGQTIKVSTNYLPDELTAILTAPLFAGDQNNMEMSTKIGTLTITIPRLILNGNTEISMSMTGSSQTNIEGQALAVEPTECDEGGYYAIISKVIKNTTWTSNLAGLAIDNANHLKKGDYLTVYGVFYGIGTRPLTSEQYVVLPSNCIDNHGVIIYDGGDDLLFTVILKDDSSKTTHGIIEKD